MMEDETNPDLHLQACGKFTVPAYLSFGTLSYTIRNQHAVFRNLYPYHSYRGSKRQDRLSVSEISSCPLASVSQKRYRSKLFSNLNKLSVFPKVYASDIEHLSVGNDGQTTYTGDVSESENLPQGSLDLETLAKAYIARETGMDRVRMVFQKDHKGDSSPQMLYIKAALIPIAFISFFINYVPAYTFAKSEFIREHNATAFRTTIEAVRKMSDYASLEAIFAGVRLSFKVTAFCTSFLLISQTLSSYRNKTSASDFIVASGITGGLARFHMGPKGFVAGSVVGMALGAVYGVVASGLLHLCGMTEDIIHLQAVMSRLEVERSIAGESIFKQRMKELTEQASGISTS